MNIDISRRTFFLLNKFQNKGRVGTSQQTNESSWVKVL